MAIIRWKLSILDIFSSIKKIHLSYFSGTLGLSITRPISFLSTAICLEGYKCMEYKSIKHFVKCEQLYEIFFI